MASPLPRVGTSPPRGTGTGGGMGHPGDQTNPGGATVKNPNKSKGGGSTPASAPTGKGGKKKRKYAGTIFEVDALNPRFDPRMRRIGSPLNMTSTIKRGWIQSEEDAQRVNFLFNPSQLDIASSVVDGVRLNEQTPGNDVMDPDYPSMGTTTGVQLLYDRTYELFSPPKNGELDFANQYGVWADVAAWFVFLGMLDEMPDSWENSMVTNPMQRKTSFLFVGPRMCYYGFVTSISVTYSHWSQNMIPVRCAVNIGYEVLPYSGAAPYKGADDVTVDLLPGVGWVGDWTFSPDGSTSNGSPLASGEVNAGSGASFLGIPFTNPDD